MVKHVNVLRRDALQDAAPLETRECLMDGIRRILLKSVDELATALVVDGGIAVEPVDVENPLRIGIRIESLRPTEIGNPRERTHPRPGQHAHMARTLQCRHQRRIISNRLHPKRSLLSLFP